MSTIVTRAGKGSALTHTEVDANFTNLNTDKIEAAQSVTLTNKTIALGSNTVSGTTAQFNTALTDGDFATLAGSETLTNKTISGSSNTLSNISNASLTNSSVTIGSTSVSLGSTATTISGLTLSSPTVNTPTLSGGTINNATIGASTPSSGAFTTLSATGVTTVQAGTAAAPAITTSGDTNTGVFFPAADTVAIGTGGTERLRVDASGNAGLGVTPAAWDGTLTGTRALQIGAFGAYVFGTGSGWDSAPYVYVGNNAYYGSGSFRYTSSKPSATYYQVNDVHVWANAATGTAGNALTFTERMRLDANGRLGLGTSSPQDMLVVSNAGNAGWEIGATSLVTVQTYNRAGSAYVDYKDNCLNRIFATNGTTERARITSGGLLLIGATAGSASRLEINGTENVCTIINSSATDANYKTSIAFTDVNGNTRGTIRVNTSATQYNTSSDYRLKENVQPMVGALDKVALLKPCTFNWKIDGHDGQGFIAHELAEVFPDAVAGEKDAIETYTDSNGNEHTRPAYQGIDTSFLVATLTAAIQEQQAMIDELKAKVVALENA